MGMSLHDQPNNSSFNSKIESAQYNVAPAVTGATRGSSRDKRYDQLGV